MMRLLLLRHAKSDWSDAGLADRDRPLSKRGGKVPRGGAPYEGERLIPISCCHRRRPGRDRRSVWCSTGSAQARASLSMKDL